MVNKDPLKVMMFVCSGNTCRSPMAEGFMNHFLKIHGLDGIWGASSSGTMAIDGLPANGLAVRVMSENGIDISRHRSKPAGSWEPPEDSLFLGMTRDHVNCLRNLFPRRRGAVCLLGEASRPFYVGDIIEVPDPFGGRLASYREIAGVSREMSMGLLNSRRDH
jgi:protein-tyrosine-phosphatase